MPRPSLGWIRENNFLVLAFQSITLAETEQTKPPSNNHLLNSTGVKLWFFFSLNSGSSCQNGGIELYVEPVVPY